MKEYKFNENTDKKYLSGFSSLRQNIFIILEKIYKIFINNKDGRIESIIDQISEVRPNVILEIGSGVLPIYQYLPEDMKKTCEYHICEINKKKVDYLLKKYSDTGYNLKIECSGVSPLPYEKDYFNFVISKGVFHHIDDVNPKKREEKKLSFLNEIKRVLKNDGINLLMDFYPEKKFKDIFWHRMYSLILFEGDYNYLSKKQAKQMFELTNYKDIKLYDINTFKGLYYNIIAKK